MSLPISVVVKRRYIPKEIVEHQKQVDHDREQIMNEWFAKIHENLKPLDASYYAYTLTGESSIYKSYKANSYKPSSRDITPEEVDKRRVACIYALRRFHRRTEANMLQDVHEDQKRVREEYRVL